MTAEQWKPVVGFEGAYEVSDLGRVRSLDRWIRHVSRRGNTNLARRPGQIMQIFRSTNGYATLPLRLNGKRKNKYVHHLVLEAFVGPKPVNMEALHLNHDRADARLENLRWGTKRENEDAKIAAGRSRSGTEHGVAKLTDDDVTAIRSARGAVMQKHLAEQYGCSKGNISAIQLRKSWRHL